MNGDGGSSDGVPVSSVLHIPNLVYTLEGRNFDSKLLTQEQSNDLVRYLSVCLKRMQNFVPQVYKRTLYMTTMSVSVTTFAEF